MKRYFIGFFLSLQCLCVSGQVQKTTTPSIALFTLEGKPTFTNEFIYLYKKTTPTKARITPKQRLMNT